MFKFAKRSAKALRQFALNLLHPGRGKQGADPETIDPLLIKAQIPRSWFTRKGPGVTASTMAVFYRFTPLQREYAIERGWFPKTWRASVKHQRELRALVEAQTS